MQRKLPSFVFLSFLSFSVFTTLFHTVANAQTSERIAAPTKAPSVFPSIEKPTAPVQTIKKPQVMFTLSSIDTPTPTITSTPNQPEPTPTTNPEPTTLPIPPTATPIPQPVVTAPSDLESFFSKYADEYKIDKEDLKRIAKCEAGFNTNADTGMYAGMFQFAAQTWIATRTAMGLDTNPDLRKNAEEAIRTAAYKISNGGRSAWPSC